MAQRGRDKRQTENEKPSVPRTAGNGKPAGPRGVSVLDKAFEIVSVLAEVDELTAAELATRINEPRSTVYRLLASLKRHRVVEAGSTPSGFRLGIDLVRLGGIVMSRFDVRSAAQSCMEEIHAELNETVFLCVRSGHNAVCIDRLDGLYVQSLALRLGGMLPLHAGAASRVLLAFSPEAEWDNYLATSDLTPFTPKTPSNRTELIAALTETRERGYAVSDGDVTIGIGAIGAPVFGHNGLVVGALSISGLRESILGFEVFESNCDLVVEGAAEISRSLGHNVTPPAHK